MKNKNIGIDGLEQHPGRQPQPPAPIKEDAKHTPGELFLDDGDFDRTGEPDELYIRGRLKDELFDVCNFGCNDTGFALDYAAALVTRYNQAPTLLKENEQLKAEIERLRKWAVETIDISQNLAHKRKEQVNVLREAIKGVLRNEDGHGNIHMMKGGKLQHELNAALSQTN